MCGTGLTQQNVCQNSGAANYVPKTLSECSDMIAAVASGKPYGAKCPVFNGKSLGISHYVEYPTCDIKAGTKFDNYVESPCDCPAGVCGEVCTDSTTSSVATSPLLSSISSGTTSSSTTSSLLSSLGASNVTTAVSPLATSPLVTTPLVTTPTASVGGDPHFRTHDGTMYSFHGECDLVMARSVSFDDGLGLDVHARTEMVGNTWSLVSNAAVRIGDDVFELNNNGTHYINYEANAILPATLANKYEIQYEEEHVHNVDNSIRTWYTIDLGNGDKIQITNFKKMISVNVAVKLSDTVGMLGTSGVPGLVARDGQTKINADEMGAQWQVNGEEAILFNEMRSPQYPESCRLPEVSMTHRRLAAADDNMTAKAKEACHGVADDLYDFCLYDVLISGNVDLARTYTAGVF
jgi:von Willebrand factor type D domain